MSATISFDQAAVYQFAKTHADYFTVSDVATMTGVTEISAYRHCSAFLELGILHNRRYGPQQLFKFAALQSPHPDIVRRLEEALPILFKQKAKRTAQTKHYMGKMASWPGSQVASFSQTKPGGRRKPDPTSRT